MQRTIQISTHSRNGLYDITREVETIVTEYGVQTGMVNVYVQGATAGIMFLFNMIAPLFAIVGNALSPKTLSLYKIIILCNLID